MYSFKETLIIYSIIFSLKRGFWKTFDIWAYIHFKHKF